MKENEHWMSLDEPDSCRGQSVCTKVDRFLDRLIKTMNKDHSPCFQERAFGTEDSKVLKDSMAERVRALFLRARSRAIARSVAIYDSSIIVSKRNHIAIDEANDNLWLEQEGQDRQVQCGYRCLVDEATI